MPKTVNAQILTLLVLIPSLSCKISSSNVTIDGKQQRGSFVPLSYYSSIVLLNLTVKNSYCTGALISPNFVLTAAHCLYGEDDSSVKVYLSRGQEEIKSSAGFEKPPLNVFQLANERDSANATSSANSTSAFGKCDKRYLKNLLKTEVKLSYGHGRTILPNVTHTKNLTDSCFTQADSDVGYEVRHSTLIIFPWAYLADPLEGTFDIALIELDRHFQYNTNERKQTLVSTLFIPPRSTISCEAVGFDINSQGHNFKEERRRLLMYTISVEKPCTAREEAEGKTSSPQFTYICQVDEEVAVKPSFADSAALLFCKGHLKHSPNGLNGIAVGKFVPGSPNTPKKSESPVVFIDICPYLTWIRTFVGPGVPRSPGDFGQGCYDASSCQRRHMSPSRIVFIFVLFVFSIR